MKRTFLGLSFGGQQCYRQFGSMINGTDREKCNFTWIMLTYNFLQHIKCASFAFFFGQRQSFSFDTDHRKWNPSYGFHTCWDRTKVIANAVWQWQTICKRYEWFGDTTGLKLQIYRYQFNSKGILNFDVHSGRIRAIGNGAKFLELTFIDNWL